MYFGQGGELTPYREYDVKHGNIYYVQGSIFM